MKIERSGRVGSVGVVASGWIALALVATALPGQELQLPRSSPRAQVTQTVGVSTITIEFGRPGVKGRQIWGASGIVPYNGGDPLPWRSGADEPTTIEFSHDVLIEGQPLAAGRYGWYSIPGENEWTVIFNRNTEDSFAYSAQEDALRVTVEPQTAPFQERLLFEFEQLDHADRAAVALRWGRKKVRVVAAFPLDEIVLSEARELLLQSPEGWLPWYQAADFVLDNSSPESSSLENGDLEEALGWIQESVRREENRANLSTQARLLEELGRVDESELVRARLEPYSRDGWQRVDEIFEWMKVAPGSLVADVGAGGGYLTTRLAEAVGDGGQVFAVDVDERSLGRLVDLLGREGVDNVTVVHGGAENPGLPPATLSSIVIVNAYHEMVEYAAMLRAMRRALQPGGRLVLVEPMSESSRGAPREEQVRNHDLDIELAREEVAEAGFTVIETSDPYVEMPGGGTQWLLVAERPKR